MVTIVEFPEMKDAFYYNENKVKKGSAISLLAHQYPKDVDELTVKEKFQRLTRLASLRPDVKTNCLHIFISFDPSEKLSPEMLKTIATEYMEKIGFGSQPYLVYEHKDTGNQHMHILTTNIEKDGHRIPTHLIGKEKSEPARKELEIKYGLVKAEDQSNMLPAVLDPTNLRKAEYGKAPTKKQISNIVRTVVKHYNFSSLGEYNAILNVFNVHANRGEEGSWIYEKRGLLYSIIDEEAIKMGKPVKASVIPGKPILDKLEKLFVKNKDDRKELKGRIARIIEDNLKDPITKEEFTLVMKKDNIDVVFRENANGFVYGVTYVDHIGLVAMNGSELGKRYSAKFLMERLSPGTHNHQQVVNQKLVKQTLQESANATDIRQAFKRWAQKGIMVVANPGGEEGNLFRMGHIQSSKKNFVPVGKKDHSLFNAQNLNPQSVNKLTALLEKFFLSNDICQPAGSLGGSWMETITGTYYSEMSGLIDDFFSTTSEFEEINYAFLRDARKKKKRKTRSR